MKTIVCPLCVQWRCVFCKSPDCDGDCEDGRQGFEPYWPDGSVAEITQREYCDNCAAALADYERENVGQEPF